MRRRLASADGGVHAGDFVGDVAVDDRPRAVAVVERLAVAGEDVDDDRLARAQLAVAEVVAVGAGADRRRRSPADWRSRGRSANGRWPPAPVRR